METLEEQHEKSVVRHSYVRVDGDELENTGMKALVLRLRCHFLGNLFGQIDAFRQHVALVKTFELVHPEYGTIYGDIESVSVQRGDRTNSAAVDITFVEDLAAEYREALFRPSVVNQAEAAFGAGQTQLMDDLVATMKITLGADASNIVDPDVLSTQSLASQLNMANMSVGARNLIRACDNALAIIDATVSTVTDIADSVVTTIEYGTQFPGRIIGSLATATQRIASLAAQTASLPSELMNSVRSSVSYMRRSVVSLGSPWMGPIIDAQAAFVGGVVVASLYEADEQRRNTLKSIEGHPGFDRMGNYVRTQSPPEVYTVNELERSLAECMEAIQVAIANNRTNRALRDMARAMVDHVSRSKLERERIKTHTVHGPVPLHLVCLQLGKSYTHAERLLAINPSITNPAAVEGTINVYA